MPFEWSNDLEIGDPIIDGQHKQLVETVNDLMHACKHGNHRDELKKTLNFLVDYTVKHFADEEAFQLKHNYPDYEQHKQLHDAFKVTASEMAARLLQEGASVALVAEAHGVIGKWLFNHIRKEDLRIAEHIQASRTN
jgi:hemerythrin